MLREEYIGYAAAVHIEGARTLRDSASAVLPCCTLFAAAHALRLQRAFTAAEDVLCRAVALSEGLLKKSGLTKYTAVAEARMRLLGVEPNANITKHQTTCEKTPDVPPGTRADVYNGFIALNIQAADAVRDFLEVIDEITAAMREGRACCAIPATLLGVLHVVNADYAVACRKLANGEEARPVCRKDTLAQWLEELRSLAVLQGADGANASAETLAALAAGGMIGGVPPILFDMLLRYERYE
ncbi:MAG: hypothetical protein K2L51_03435 [Clostridiales bacterium]|nr:hypothetical protein [Clostridiales bacterium]